MNNFTVSYKLYMWVYYHSDCTLFPQKRKFFPLKKCTGDPEKRATEGGGGSYLNFEFLQTFTHDLHNTHLILQAGIRHPFYTMHFIHLVSRIPCLEHVPPRKKIVK